MSSDLEMKPSEVKHSIFLHAQSKLYCIVLGVRSLAVGVGEAGGLWIQMIESTLRLVDQIDKKESKTQC